MATKKKRKRKKKTMSMKEVNHILDLRLKLAQALRKLRDYED